MSRLNAAMGGGGGSGGREKQKRRPEASVRMISQRQATLDKMVLMKKLINVLLASSSSSPPAEHPVFKSNNRGSMLPPILEYSDVSTDGSLILEKMNYSSSDCEGGRGVRGEEQVG